ncbi:sigma-70 family RNA polymerase sigma factor [Sandaracinobacteroides saxicola]|uniref:Sigma-70 family RNA polymerase sigma factor n=2 Tax=Sandaracinobacteroides saxicola TaxID=2759707 RepID=A0A7G5IMT8_9SPHN|nr:sigma-70 family RNA polymerase sigma factor [Sandaracinobacteroides saxicola]
MVYDSSSMKLFAVAMRILSDRQEAEDVLQDVFLTIWRKAAEYDAGRASPMTWMTTITRNRAIDRVRARGTRAAVPVEEAHELADERPTPEASAMASEAATRLHAALAGLDPRHQAVIRAAYVGGLTYEALAEREGIPVGTLKTWVRRALIRLRGEMVA